MIKSSDLEQHKLVIIKELEGIVDSFIVKNAASLSERKKMNISINKNRYPVGLVTNMCNNYSSAGWDMDYKPSPDWSASESYIRIRKKDTRHFIIRLINEIAD